MAGITLGRTPLLCTLLLWGFQVCCGAIIVKVDPKVEVNRGNTARLPCAYSGTTLDDILVNWYIAKEESDPRIRVAFRKTSGHQDSDSDTPLSGRVSIAEDFTLTITSVKPTDQLTYYCQVIAGKDGSEEASTKLEVFVAPQKPEIKTPSSQAISVGASSSSEIGTCTTMNGFPAPRIIWFKDNMPLPEVKDKKENTYMVPSTVKEASGLFTIKSVLYMKPTKADKDSLFHCTVEYSMAGEQNKNIQMKSDPMKIVLHYPFEHVMFGLLNATDVKEGDDVTLKCETDGNPQPFFDFYKQVQSEAKKIEGTDSLLTLKSVKRTDSGNYTCTATDFELNEKSAYKVLVVNYIDQMSVTPAEPKSVKLGDKVEWQCKTKASKPHTVQWKKGSTVLSQDGTLSIESVTYENAGEYVCVGAVSDVPGLTAQASVNLTVTGKPQIENPAVGEVTKEGEEVTLKCSAYGYPSPKFTWKPSAKETISREDNKIVSTATFEATADIMENGVTCEVSNEYGKDSKTLFVTVKRANTAQADKQQGGPSAVVVAVVVCVLLLLLLVSLIYFLSKKTTMCSKKDNKEPASSNVNDIVVEMKSDKANEEAGLLNKKVSTEQ